MSFPEIPPRNRNIFLRGVVYLFGFFFLIFVGLLIVGSLFIHLISIVIGFIAFCIHWLLGKAAGLFAFVGIGSTKVWNFCFSSFLPICEMCGLPITNRFPGKRHQCCGAIAHIGCHSRKNSRQAFVVVNMSKGAKK